MGDLSIEPMGSTDFGPCECCGGTTRSVWGTISRGEAAEASYFVRWTLGEVERHGANFDLIVGRWGDDASNADRFAVALEFRVMDDGPWFMVIDAGTRPVAESDLVGRALRRDEVIGTPLAPVAFELVDAIWMQDERIGELTGADRR